MAKRYCTMTAGNPGIDEVSSEERSEDELEKDDPNKPIMEGSDYEFSDFSSMQNEEDNEGFLDRTSLCMYSDPSSYQHHYCC